MFLLDTNVLSALRRPSLSRNQRAAGWVAGKPADSHLISAITLGEIERGIVKQRAIDPSHAADLQAWLDAVIAAFASRILPVDTDVAREWGRLSQRVGRDDADILIAATARVRGLTVVTRTVSDFAPLDVRVVDPFAP